MSPCEYFSRLLGRAAGADADFLHWAVHAANQYRVIPDAILRSARNSAATLVRVSYALASAVTRSPHHRMQLIAQKFSFIANCITLLENV